MPIYCIGKLKKGYIGFDGGHTLKKVYGPEGLIWQDTVLVNPPTDTAPNFYYDGIRKTNLYNCPEGVTMTGTDRASDGGRYVATYTPQDGYAWADDGSQRTITVTMSIYYKWNVWNAAMSVTESRQTFTATWSGIFDRFDTPMKYAYKFARDCNIVNGKYVLSGSVAEWITLGTGSQRVAEGLDYKKYVGLIPDGQEQENGFDIVYQTDSVYAYITARSSSVYLTTNNDEKTGNVYKKTITRTYSKGDTSRGIVTSLEIDTYPENGTPDNDNWYVKAW